MGSRQRKEGKTRKMLRKAKNAFASAAVLVSTIAILNCERTENLPQDNPPITENPPPTHSPEELPECAAERKYLECGEVYEVTLGSCGLDHYECADIFSDASEYYRENGDGCPSAQIGPLKIKVLSFDVLPPSDWMLEHGINETKGQVRARLTSECDDFVQFSSSCGSESISAITTPDGTTVYKSFSNMLPEYYNAVSVYPIEVSTEPGNEYVKLSIETAPCDGVPRYCFLAGGTIVNGEPEVENSYQFDDYEIGVNEAGEILIKNRETGEILKVIGEDDLSVSRLPEPNAFFPSEFYEYMFSDYVILVHNIDVFGITWRGAYVTYPCLTESE